MSLSKKIFQKGIQKNLPSWLKATRSAVDDVWDVAQKVAGTDNYERFVEQTAKNISTDAFERKVESAINAKYAGKFKNSTLQDISVNIWNSDVDKIYAFKTDKELGNFIYQGLENYGNRGFNNYVDYVEKGLAKKGVAGSLTKEELATLNDVKNGLFDNDWKYGKLKGEAKKKVNARIDDLAAAREKAWYESANNAADEYAALQEVDKVAARDKARKATAAVTDADTHNVLKPRTEQLRQEARENYLNSYRSADSPYENYIDSDDIPERLREYKSPEDVYRNYIEPDEGITYDDLTNKPQRKSRSRKARNLEKFQRDGTYIPKKPELDAQAEALKKEGFPPVASQSRKEQQAARYNQQIEEAKRSAESYQTFVDYYNNSLSDKAKKQGFAIKTKINSNGESVTKEANKNYALYGKAALGVAVSGTALCTALSSTGGQQNNAQLYGQQPLY